MARSGGGFRGAAALRAATAGTREAGDERRYIRHDNNYYVNGAPPPPTGSYLQYPRATHHLSTPTKLDTPYSL